MDVLLLDCCSHDPAVIACHRWFKKMLLQYIAGMFTVLPFNLPGFAFHDALKAKDKLLAAMELELGPQAQAILAGELTRRP